MTNTCGEGLAHHAALPAALAQLMAAVADNLDAHLTTLNPNDVGSEPERRAYTELVQDHLEVERRLQALSQKMAGYRTLPMATHDTNALHSPRVRQALASLVSEERAVTTLLQEWIEQHQQML